MIYYYRGMSALDLLTGEIAIDPSIGLFGEHKELFANYFIALKSLCDTGFEFNVVDTYTNPLSRIVGWSLRDLADATVDFSPNYDDAASYAMNFAGSQLKHNLRIIVDTLPVKLKLTDEVKNILYRETKRPHIPVVLKVCGERAEFTATEFDDVMKLINLLPYSSIEEIIEL